MGIGCPQAHKHHKHRDSWNKLLRDTVRSSLDVAFCFHDEPGGAEKSIAEHKSDAAHDIEGCQPIERTARKLAVCYRNSADDGAKSHPLSNGGQPCSEAE